MLVPGLLRAWRRRSRWKIPHANIARGVRQELAVKTFTFSIYIRWATTIFENCSQLVTKHFMSDRFWILKKKNMVVFATHCDSQQVKYVTRIQCCRTGVTNGADYCCIRLFWLNLMYPFRGEKERGHTHRLLRDGGRDESEWRVVGSAAGMPIKWELYLFQLILLIHFSDVFRV